MTQVATPDRHVYLGLGLNGLEDVLLSETHNFAWWTMGNPAPPGWASYAVFPTLNYLGKSIIFGAQAPLRSGPRAEISFGRYFTDGATGNSGSSGLGGAGVTQVGVEVWCRLSSLPSSTNYAIFGNYAFYMFVDAATHKLNCYVEDSGGTHSGTITGMTTLQVDTDYLFGADFDGTNLHLYVDGVSDATPVAVASFGTLAADKLGLACYWKSSVPIGQPFEYLIYDGITIYDVIYYGVPLSTVRILAHLAAAPWVDVTADLRGELTVEYGVRGSTPKDRVAGPGEAAFELANDDHRYSLLHASCREGFDLGVPVLVTFDDAYASVTRYKFWGHIESVTSQIGVDNARIAKVKALDFMQDMAESPLQGIETQIDATADEIVWSVINGMLAFPRNMNFDACSDVYPYALDSSHDESTTALAEAQRAVMSELGYLYPIGDTTGGGTLRLEKRTRRAISAATVSLTLDNTMETLVAPDSRDSIMNVVRVTGHPRDTEASKVLYAITNAQPLEPGESIVVFGPYRDPGQQAARVGGTDMVDPVATTDYQAFENADGSGTDYTSSVTIVATLGGNGAYFTITSGASSRIYLTKLQCRGTILRGYNSITASQADSISVAKYRARYLDVDCPYQNDVMTLNGMAQWLLAMLKAQLNRAEQVSYLANRDATHMAAALAIEPGMRIAVKEDESGVDCELYVNGVRIVVDDELLMRVNYWTVSAEESASYLILDVPGSDELDEGHLLGYV